tara:strand:+ start:401 stop:595 length:195 start_codon:yes stop_codon:yes gene_type:complete
MTMNFAKVKNKDLFDEFSTYNSVEDKVQFLLYCQKKFPTRNINWQSLLKVWISKLPDNKTASSS